MGIASYLKRLPVPAVLVGIASYLKRPPVPAVLVGIASYLKRLPVPAVLAGNASYLKRLPVPAVLGGALYAGYTGDIPFAGASMDALFTEIDVSIFEVVMYPAIFLFFSGLTAAWLIYLFRSLVRRGRRRRALQRALQRALIKSRIPATSQPAQAATSQPAQAATSQPAQAATLGPMKRKKKYAPGISMPSSS